MTISQVIAKLEQIRAQEGDIDVVYQTMSHVFDVDLVVKERRSGDKCVLVNS